MPSDTILFALSQKPPKTSELHTEKTTLSDVASFQTKTPSVKKSIKGSVIVLKSIHGFVLGNFMTWHGKTRGMSVPTWQ